MSSRRSFTAEYKRECAELVIRTVNPSIIKSDK